MHNVRRFGVGVVLAACTASTTGGAPLSIAIPKSAPDVRLAVTRDLADVLERMTGARPEVVRGESRPDRDVILVGSEFAPEDVLTTLTDARIGFDGYIIRSQGPRGLLLCGRTEQGHANAVYGWLRELGCRWFMPGPHGELIPERRNLELSGWDRVERPAYVHRQLWYSGLGHVRERAPAEAAACVAELNEWQRRNRMGQGVPVRFGHSFLYVVPPAEYFGTHPEYFAERAGQRVSDGQLCTTNEGVVRIFAEAAIAAFDANGALKSFSLSPNDGAGWCHCQACEALDPPAARGTETGKADRVVTFVNAVARRVKEEHPDRWLAFYAYAGCVRPPTYADPDDNVLVVLAHYVFDSLRGIDDPASSWNVTFKGYVEEWGAVAEQMFIREYYCRYWAAWPMWPAVAADIPYLRQRNVNGFNAELEYRAEGAEIGWYLLGQLCWDPTQAPEALLQELFRGLYGPAAEDIQAYFGILREAAADPKLRARGGLDEIPALFPPERITRAREQLEAAQAKAATEGQRFQVQRSADAMEMMAAYYKLLAAVRAQDAPDGAARDGLRAIRDNTMQVLERIHGYDPARYWSTQRAGGVSGVLEEAAFLLGETDVDPWAGDFRSDSFGQKAISLARMVESDGLNWSNSVDNGYVYGNGTTAAWYVRHGDPIRRCVVAALTYDNTEGAGWLEWRISFDRGTTWTEVQRVDANRWQSWSFDVTRWVAGRTDFVLGVLFAPGANTLRSAGSQAFK